MDDISFCTGTITISESLRKGYISIWGEITFNANGKSFPANYWDDCLDEIIPIWISNIDSFIRYEQSDCKLPFMDGPFEIRIHRDKGSNLSIRCIERGKDDSPRVTMVASTDIVTLAYAVLSCVSEFLDKCQKLYSGFNKPKKGKEIISAFRRLSKLVDSL